MATIAKNVGKKKTTYSVSIRLRGHRPVFATFDRRTDAKAFARKTEADITAGRYGVTAESMRTTFGAMIDRYLSDVSIRASQANTLRWWKDQLGDKTLANVGPADIAALRDFLRQGTTKYKKQRAPATVNRYLAYLSTVYSRAIREYQIADTNPVRSVSKLKEPKGRIRYLSDVERKALLGACEASDEPHLHSFVVAALMTGARSGELIALDWPDIDFARGVARLENTKNGERRTIPIRGQAFELLKARRGIAGPVFVSRAGNRFTAYNKSFNLAKTEAGIVDFRFHDLRHTAASMLAQAGCSLPEIGHLLGHKSAQITMRYAHLCDKNVIDLGDKLDQLMFR